MFYLLVCNVLLITGFPFYLNLLNHADKIHFQYSIMQVMLYSGSFEKEKTYSYSGVLKFENPLNFQ